MVYNANSGFKNAVLDTLHKITSPDTYPCDLCALTYGNFSEKTVWKNFRKQSTVKINFYHIDEFETKFGSKIFKYPIALLFDNNCFKTIISPEEFKNMRSTEQLINYMEEKIVNITRGVNL